MLLSNQSKKVVQPVVPVAKSRQPTSNDHTTCDPRLTQQPHGGEWHSVISGTTPVERTTTTIEIESHHVGNHARQTQLPSVIDEAASEDDWSWLIKQIDNALRASIDDCESPELPTSDTQEDLFRDLNNEQICTRVDTIDWSWHLITDPDDAWPSFGGVDGPWILINDSVSSIDEVAAAENLIEICAIENWRKAGLPPCQ